MEQLRDEGDVLVLARPIVATSADFEVPAFAPVRTVGVPHKPVFDYLSLGVRALAVADQDGGVGELGPLEALLLLRQGAHVLVMADLGMRVGLAEAVCSKL